MDFLQLVHEVRLVIHEVLQVIKEVMQVVQEVVQEMMKRMRGSEGGEIWLGMAKR